MPSMAAMTFRMQFGGVVLVMLGQTLATAHLRHLSHLFDAQPPLVLVRACWTPCAAKNPVASCLPFVAFVAAEPVAGSRHDVFGGQAGALPVLCRSLQADRVRRVAGTVWAYRHRRRP